MPSPLPRGRAPIGRAASLALALLGAVAGPALAQNPSQGGTVSTDPAQAGAQFGARPKAGPSARGNAGAADAAAHPAAPLAAGPAPAARPPPNPPATAEAPPAGTPGSHRQEATRDPAQAALIRRGAYIAAASDCAPCHMSVGGTPYAGGLILNTPFGQMSTPNITPDRQTGIGSWTADQFYGVIHNGIGPGHQYIYPTMTFTSYTRMPREDVDALYAFLKSLPPAAAPRIPVSLNFPFNIRLSLLGWRLLFFRAGTYKDDPSRSAQWNRGAYLVQGPGHCGECHSPRNALGGVIDSKSLSGGIVDAFLAPNISSDPRWGVGGWSEDEIVDFLRKGANAKGVVYGPMVEVVHESMARMTEPDVRAIAVYLKNTPARTNTQMGVLAGQTARASISRGEALYGANCAQCHQASGAGVAGAIPNLAGNESIRANDPSDAITPMLAGLLGQGSYGAMPRFAGALSDADMADIANYIRTAWNNGSTPNATARLVRGVRAAAPTGIGGSVAARDFGCPRIGDGTVPGTLATEEEVSTLARGDTLQNRISSVIDMVRKDNPDAGSAELVTTLNAAYCPVIAQRADLNRAQKAAALIAFSDLVGQQFERSNPANVTRVQVTAQLTPEVIAQINQAAASAGMTPGAFIAKQLAAGARPGGK